MIYIYIINKLNYIWLNNIYIYIHSIYYLHSYPASFFSSPALQRPPRPPSSWSPPPPVVKKTSEIHQDPMIFRLPSGYVKIAIENCHRNSGFTHWKWWFSIIMLVYQRVYSSYTMLYRCDLSEAQFFAHQKKKAGSQWSCKVNDNIWLNYCSQNWWQNLCKTNKCCCWLWCTPHRIWRM